MTKTEQKYVAGVMASSEAMGAASSTILILPKAENVSVVDEGFFNMVSPNFVVISKKLKSTTAVASNQKIPKEIDITTKTGRIKKPSKPPFDISSVPDISIINLATDGEVEFISDGLNFTEKKRCD